MENPFSLVASKSLPKIEPNDWDYTAPSMPIPFAGVDINSSIIAGCGWKSEEAGDDAVLRPSRQREAGGLPPSGRPFQENPTIFIRDHDMIDPYKLVDAHDDYTMLWYQHSVNNLPTNSPIYVHDSSIKRGSSLQLSLMFMNLGNMKRVSHVQNKHGKKTLRDTRLSMLQALWGTNWAHVTMCAEAGELPQDPDLLLRKYGITGKHSEKANDLAVHARVGQDGFVQLLWEDLDHSPVEGKQPKYNGHAAIFEVNFGKSDAEENACDPGASCSRPKSAPKRASRRREQEDRREQESFPKNGRVWHAGLQTVRCCVVHINNDCARRRCGVARCFFWKILQQAIDYGMDFIAGDGNAACYSSRKNQKHFDIPNATIPALLRKMTQVTMSMGGIILCLFYFLVFENVGKHCLNFFIWFIHIRSCFVHRGYKPKYIVVPSATCGIYALEHI